MTVAYASSFCLCNWTNDQWSLVPSRFIGAGTEERIDGVRKSIREGVDEKSGLNIVEGHHSLIKVHVDSNSRWSDADRQAGWRLCAEGVFTLITQTEEPVAVGGAYGDLALPVDRPARHSQVPISLPTNVHLERKQNTGTLWTWVEYKCSLREPPPITDHLPPSNVALSWSPGGPAHTPPGQNALDCQGSADVVHHSTPAYRLVR